MTIRVLVADDHETFARAVGLLLDGDPDIDVVGKAGDGASAVEAIRQQSPDLVFLDVQMPELGGFEVLESFDREAIPYVIFVTAYDQYAVRAFEVHAFDYLLKPFDR